MVALPLASTLAPAEAAPLVLAQNNNRNRNREIRTLEGVVTANRQGRDFTLRLNNGQRITVRSNESEPRRLSTGDRVRVVGSYRRNQPSVFRADSVQILTNQNNNNNRSYTGRVTNVDSDQRFDLTIDGTTYNVITSSRLPRRLNKGDQVRVFGRRSGDNDIINATVVVINNNGNNYNNYNNFRTYTGRVTNVDSDQRFDLNVDGTTYNVISTTRLPRRLNEGDQVRVFGRPIGDNDISSASVVVINNNGNSGNSDNNSNYNTYTGRVTNVDSDQRFDINVDGTTYNVLTSSRLPRGLNEGDRVRVYGRRTGDNDISSATVVVINSR